MEYYIDASYRSLNKKGEELCGDNVEYIKTEDGCIMVLSDGLGSGVKANILATLTSKIAVTMLMEGSTIDETMETIVNTLPECKVRKLAYSTFTIIKLSDNGECYMVEYDNPPCFFYRNGCDLPIDKVERHINGKTIYESNFRFLPGDLLTVVSDGAVHAGVGELLNLGWQWDSINDFLREMSQKKFARDIANGLLEVCNTLYDGKPGDDTTVLAIKLQPVKYLNLFTGPPKDSSLDWLMVDILHRAPGMKILCGGTTANIVASHWKREIQIDLTGYSPDSLPPVGHLEGVDLVTEGLITLSRTVDYLREYKTFSTAITQNDGAGILARHLLYDASHVNIYAGTAVNPAHQNPDFPLSFNIKLKIVKDLVKILHSLDKKVVLDYL